MPMINFNELTKAELIKLRDSIDAHLNKDMKGMALPTEYGKRPVDRIIHVYSLFWKQKYGRNPIVQYVMIARLFKPLFSQFSEYQIGLLVACHMNWKGANGDSDFIEKRLLDSCYPLSWLPKAVNEYIAFIVNNQGINFDDENVVKETLDNLIKRL